MHKIFKKYVLVLLLFILYSFSISAQTKKPFIVSIVGGAKYVDSICFSYSNSTMSTVDSAYTGCISASGIGAKTTAIYPAPATNEKHLIQINVTIVDFNFPEQRLCELQYDALNNTATWILDDVFQPVSNFPAIKCTYKMYANHLFLFVTNNVT